MIYELLEGSTVINIIDASAEFMATQYPKGNYREVPEPPAPEVNSTPQVLTMRQARLALSAAGLLSSVNAAVAHADEATRIEWEYATSVERTWPTLIAMADAVGLDAAQIDQLFVLGAAL